MCKNVGVGVCVSVYVVCDFELMEKLVFKGYMA